MNNHFDNHTDFTRTCKKAIELQSKIHSHFPSFPQYLSQETFLNAQKTVSVFTEQVDFLFSKCKELNSARLDDDYTIMMNEKSAADLNLLKLNTQKQDEIIKKLRGEKEYYLKQVECLRKELEQAKTVQFQVNPHHTNIFGQPNQEQMLDKKSNRSTIQSSTQGHSKSPSTTQGDNIHLLKELKELRTELQSKDESISMKVDTIKGLQESLDQTKRHHLMEIERIKKELQDGKEGTQQKDEIIKDLQSQILELMQAHAIEIPISTLKGKKSTSKSRSKQSTKGPGTGILNKKLNFIREMNDEMSKLIEEDDSYLQTQDLISFPQSLANTLKKSSRRNNRQSVSTCPIQPPSEALISLETMLVNQLSAAKLAEQAIVDLQNTQQEKLDKYEEVSQSYGQLVEQFNNLVQEKQSYQDQMKSLQKENEHIKQKFANLLDQFQEYVNSNEIKIQEEELQQKISQDNILNDLQATIRELEHLSEGLQNELTQKEELYQALKSDYGRLEHKFKESLQHKDGVDEAKDKQIKHLEEEVGYLKKHFEVELGLLRDENDILKKEIQEVIPLKMVTGPAYNKYSSPLQPSMQRSETEGDAPTNTSLLGSMNAMNPFQSTHGQFRQTINKTSSANHIGGRYNQTGPLGQERVKDIIQSTQQNFERMKRDLHEKEKIIEEKNLELSRLRTEITDVNNRIHAESSYHKRTEAVMDEMNKEISRLNLELQESENRMIYYQQQMNHQSKDLVEMKKLERGQVSEQTRRSLIYDFKSIVDKLGQDLITMKQILSKEKPQNVNQQFYKGPQVIGPVNSEDQMIKVLQDKIGDAKELLGLINDINYLVERDNDKSICSQLKISQNILDSNYQIKRNADTLFRNGHIQPLYELLLSQITKAETLTQDNALLQKAVYKFETTLQEMDAIFRSDERDAVIFDLKKLTEAQLKEIVKLQREIEIRGHPVTIQQDKKFEEETIKFLKQENDELKLQLQRRGPSTDYEKEDLLKERRNLLSLCDDLENQAKDGNQNLQKALNQIGELEKVIEKKEDEIELIRKKITEVAVVFEKKEIKQKYSFEVLCDFIFDKANRLYGKYENVCKENKVMKEEKNYYFQRRLDQLEQENESMKETIIQINLTIKEFIPRLTSLLHEKVLSVENGGIDQIRQVLEKVEDEIHHLKKENKSYKEQFQDVIKQLDQYKTESTSSKDFEKRKLEQREETLRKELDAVKREKERLCDKYAEMALALKDLTEELRQQKEQNDYLKAQVSQYNSSPRKMAQAKITRNSVKTLQDQTNASVNSRPGSGNKFNDFRYKQYNQQNMKENATKDRFSEKVQRFQQKMAESVTSTNGVQYQFRGEEGKRLSMQRKESMTSYFTDEDDEARAIQSEFGHIETENGREQFYLQNQ